MITVSHKPNNHYGHTRYILTTHHTVQPRVVCVLKIKKCFPTSALEMALPSRGKRLDDFSTTAQLYCFLTSTAGYRDSDLTVLLLNIFYSHMSMLSVCKQVSTTVTKVRLSPLLQQVRFAGGGGRPGGKPTLNWRQKQQLRIAR